MFLRAKTLRYWGPVHAIAHALQSLPEDLHDKLIAVPIKAGNDKYAIYLPNADTLINLNTAQFSEENAFGCDVTRVWANSDDAESFLIATPFEDVCNVLAHNVFDTTGE